MSLALFFCLLHLFEGLHLGFGFDFDPGLRYKVQYILAIKRLLLLIMLLMVCRVLRILNLRVDEVTLKQVIVFFTMRRQSYWWSLSLFFGSW